LLLRRCAQN